MSSFIERMEKRCIVDMHYVIPEGPDVPKRQKRPSLRDTTEFVAGETKMSEGNNTDVAVPLYSILSFLSHYRISPLLSNAIKTKCIMDKQEFLKTRAGVHFLVRNARILRQHNVKMSVQQFLQDINDRMVVGEVTDFWGNRVMTSAGILLAKDPETGIMQFCMGNDPTSLAFELWAMGWYN